MLYLSSSLTMNRCNLSRFSVKKFHLRWWQWQGDRSWQAFGKCKKCLQFIRWALICYQGQKRCFCTYYPNCNKKLIFAHICNCMGPLLISHKQHLKSVSTPSSIPTTTIFTLCYCNLPQELTAKLMSGLLGPLAV